MFLTAHIMIAFIIYEVLNLDANLLLFLLFSILPDASWPFFKNHRKDSWYHTLLAFSWTLFFHPYWIAVLSHFIADFFTGGIRPTPFDKKTIGIKFNEEEKKKMGEFFLKRLLNHIKFMFQKRKWMVISEIILLIICIAIMLS